MYKQNPKIYYQPKGIFGGPQNLDFLDMQNKEYLWF